MAGSAEVPLVHLREDSTYRPSKVKVSSVLNRDIKQFGKKFMFDDDEETCWNSDQGTPQYISIELPQAATVSGIRIRFQGGFASRHCVLSSVCDNDLTELLHFYPEDINSLQVFSVPLASKPVKTYKIEFRTSTDFFGRVTIYHFQLFGQVT